MGIAAYTLSYADHTHLSCMFADSLQLGKWNQCHCDGSICSKTDASSSSRIETNSSSKTDASSSSQIEANSSSQTVLEFSLWNIYACIILTRNVGSVVLPFMFYDNIVDYTECAGSVHTIQRLQTTTTNNDYKQPK